MFLTNKKKTKYYLLIMDDQKLFYPMKTIVAFR
ncbi:hypothetical protein SAG0093_00990 [Streptococcus agalactiae BSU454]|nr:hypothetical protein SAG0093_00990 [Streptococcus agalactiae BSU454]